MTLDELEQCWRAVLQYLRTMGVESIDEGQYDFYWNVPPPDWLEPSKDPTLTVGSFVDDLAELRKLVSEPERASTVDLERIANILRLLSHQAVR